MTFPGRIEDYDSIKRLEPTHRRYALGIVRHTLGGTLMHGQNVVIRGAIGNGDEIVTKQVRAASDAVMKIEETERTAWMEIHGQDI